MRAVVDTNLIVSGSLWDGPAIRLMEAVRDRRVELFLPAELYVELEAVVNRPKFTKRLAARGTTPANMLFAIRAVAVMVFPQPLPLPANLRDPDDLMVPKCAVIPVEEK